VQPPEVNPTRDVPLPDLSILALITAAGAALRFHALTVKSFWFDEGVSVGIARLDGYNFLRILWRREANMSLYYLLLRAWLHLGHSEAFVRSLSVVFGVAAIPAIYFLGRRLFDSRIGLIAAALLCVNSYHVRYSQEARSYSLTVFLCILSSLYFIKLLNIPSRRNRIFYVLFSTLAVYSHFFSGLMLLAHWISLRFLDPVPKEIKRIWLPVAVAVSPAVAFVATTGAGPLSWIQRPGLHDLWQLALDWTGNGGALVVLLFAAACFVAVSGNAGPKSRFLLLWIFFPVLLVLAVSIARPVFLARYFIFSLPALLLLAASGLARIRARWLFAAFLLLFLGMSLRGVAAFYRERATSPDENWRAASQYLLANSRPGDALVFHIAMGRMPYEYYRSLQTDSAAGPDALYPHHGPQITYLDFVEKPNYALLGAEVPQHPRVWLVIYGAGPPAGLDKTASALLALISAAEPIADRRDFGGIQVVLCGKTGSQ
jgi:mannosyltransferase